MRVAYAWRGLVSNGYAHGAFSNHYFDLAIVIPQLAQHIAGVLADAGGWSSDRSLVDFKPGRRLRLPHTSDHWLIELRDDVARDDLLVMDDLAAAQDRRAGKLTPDCAEIRMRDSPGLEPWR